MVQIIKKIVCEMFKTHEDSGLRVKNHRKHVNYFQMENHKILVICLFLKAIEIKWRKVLF